jgi:paraquat-inducible protein A
MDISQQHGILAACHECDLLNRVPPLPEDGRACCRRCGATLFSNPRNCLERTLALALAAAFLLALANAFPFLGLGAPGSVVETNLLSGVVTLFQSGMPLLAGVVLLTIVVAPAAQVIGLLYVLLPLHFGRRLPLAGPIMRAVSEFGAWSMMEVFLLGILVAMVKLGGMAEVILGVSLWGFGGLVIVLASTMSTLQPHVIWEALERARPWP